MILDTNILIAHLNGDPRVIEIMSDWKYSGRPLFISSISVAETLALPTLTPYDRNKTRAYLSNFLSIPFDNGIAEVAAAFKGVYRIDLPDAAIAATAYTRNLPLATRDRPFRKIKEIAVVEL